MQENETVNMIHHASKMIPLPARREGYCKSTISCAWPPLRAQLLQQWSRLTPEEIDEAGPDRHKLALLLQLRCGVDSDLAENYLRNFERTLPLA
jgi:hypothetical protein